jgi:hypothetical protein
MPLTRDSVTIASRVMLPTYTAFALFLGIVYVTDPDGRLAHSTSFPVLPTAVWGVGFVVVGLLQIAAMIQRDRRLYVLSLAPLLVWCLLWGLALVYSAARDGTSFTAPAFPLFVAFACWASMLSLIAGES